jgi:LacI family transcriptional regulator
MRDVAAVAGVSSKTVSRVVNAEAGVSADVRDRVEKAVLQLGYRHNLAASNLRRADSRTYRYRRCAAPGCEQQLLGQPAPQP